MSKHIELYEDDDNWETLVSAVSEGFDYDEHVFSSDSDHGSHMCSWLRDAHECNTVLVSNTVLVTLDDQDDNIYGWYTSSLAQLIDLAKTYLDLL